MSELDYTINDQGILVPAPALREWSRSANAWDRHWAYHRICRNEYRAMTGAPPAPTPIGRQLSTDAVCLLPGILPASDAQALSETIDQFVERLGDAEKVPAATRIPWSPQRATMLRSMMPVIFSDALSAAIEEYFGSYFQVFSVSMSRVWPRPDDHCSFLWHRDGEPPQQLHLMIYLTGASTTDGSTFFLPLEESRRAAKAGYSYPPLDQRTIDLSAVMGADSQPPRVIEPDMPPGSGALFAAPRILHRGNWPVCRERDTILFLILPSHRPWAMRADRALPKLLAERRELTALIVDPFEDCAVISKDLNVTLPDWIHQCDLYPPGTSAA